LVGWGLPVSADASQTEITQLFNKIDVSRENWISFDEFCDWAIKEKFDLDETTTSQAESSDDSAVDSAVVAQQEDQQGRRNAPVKKYATPSEELKEKLPLGRAPAARKRREELFNELDGKARVRILKDATHKLTI
jgi:hypothetical protein